MPRSLYIFILLLAPAVLLSSGVLSAQTDPAELRFIPPNPKAVLSVDWKTLRATHIGALLREKYVDVDPASAIPGVEFLDDVDRFMIASSARAHADETTEPPMLVVARGHFDLAKVRQV